MTGLISAGCGWLGDENVDAVDRDRDDRRVGEPDREPRLPSGADADTVAAALRDAGVVGVTQLFAEDAGTFAFELLIKQPLNHDDPDGETFVQRAVLVHRDANAPMVLNPTGYMLFEGYEQLPEELTTLLQGNQLQIEHRFFGASVPNDVDADDWQYLTVRQSAADHHHIVELLKPLYTDAWLETGHSKGGMTSVYHHVLYPDDLDAVVAYVAPISFAINDERGQDALDVIGDAACRDIIRAYQRNAASQRDDIIPIMQAASPTRGPDEIEGYFAYSIGSLEWGYWQYGNGCDEAGFYVPNPDPAGTAAELGLDFNLDAFTDTSFLPYSYQVQNELGQPDQRSAHLDDLLGDIDVDVFVGYGALPFARPEYDGGETMREIQRLVLEHDDIVFVYGGFDPWGAVAFDEGDAGNVSVVAAGKNHGALMLDLEPAARDAALNVVLSRTGDISLDTSAFFSTSHVREAAWRAVAESLGDRARQHFATRSGVRPAPR